MKRILNSFLFSRIILVSILFLQTFYKNKQNVKDVYKLLGLANYYRWFVKDFARVAKHLHKITRNDMK